MPKKGFSFVYAYKGFLINVYNRLLHYVYAIITVPRDWEGVDKLCKEIRKYGESFARQSEFLCDNSICFAERKETGVSVVVRYYFKQKGSRGRNEMKPVYNAMCDGLCDLIKAYSPHRQRLKIRAPDKDFI